MSREVRLLACAVLITAGLQGSTRAAATTLVRDGQPLAVIVTAQSPTPAAQLAALELQHHIQKITGAVLPIKAAGDAASGQFETRVLVGAS
jgi:hypothetical protein